MTNVLVTGAAGTIGQPVCQELERRGHRVRAFDRVPSPGVSDAIVADIIDAGAVRQAVSGTDCVVHLAAQPSDTDFTELVGPNVIGLYNVMDAARQAQTTRVVLASSIQVLSRSAPSEGPARVDMARPMNHYALTKLWAEQMGAMYSRRFGLSVIAVRIAWVVRNLEEVRRMLKTQRPALYLSHADAGRFFAHAVEAQDIQFAVVYAASHGGEELFDMEPARRLLGYEARDRWPEGLAVELPDGFSI
jgi:uronate dehydrogenase